MVVEVVELGGIVEQRLENARAVEQDHAPAELARLGLAEGVASVDADPGAGRFVTLEEAALLRIPDLVAHGDRLGGGKAEIGPAPGSGPQGVQGLRRRRGGADGGAQGVGYAVVIAHTCLQSAQRGPDVGPNCRPDR